MPLPWNTVLHRAVCAVALPLVVLGGYLSTRLAIADARFRFDTPESVAEAVRLEPGNAAYHDLLAEHLESAGQNPDPEREKAIRLSPLESSHWIGLGVRAEVEGDYARAEKYLLEAARVNVGFDPRWALMNFYFRRGNTAQFTVWTKRALAISYGDLAPAFRLCWLAIGNEQGIEALLPPRPDVQWQYLLYLTASDRLDAAPSVARSLAKEADETRVSELLDYCDAAAQKDATGAASVWNILCERKLQPFDPIDAAHGRAVTNPEFRMAPTGRGFDWTLPAVDGVSPGQASGGTGLSFDMSGNEPQDCVLLWQILPLEAGRHYRLDYVYSGAATRDASGLSWEVQSPVDAPPSDHSDDLTPGEESATGHLAFTAGPASGTRIRLRYARRLGTPRRKGELVLRKVTVVPTP